MALDEIQKQIAPIMIKSAHASDVRREVAFRHEVGGDELRETRRVTVVDRAGPVDSAGHTHYTFARLDQRTWSVTTRGNFSVSPALSIQAYAQPFASWGSYGDVRELAAPRASSYDARFRPFVSANAPAGVDAKQLNANVVVRWEYHPGSTLFVVWSQGRQCFAPTIGTRDPLGNLGGVFGLPADNTFLVKLSYWFGR